MKEGLAEAARLYREGRIEEAERACRAILTEVPMVAAAYNLLGVILRAGKRPEEAIDAYKEASRLLPRDPGIASNLCNALCDAGRYEEAIQAGRTAVDFEPGNASYNSNLAHAYARMGDHARAVEFFSEALKLAPAPATRGELGRSLFLARRFAEAETVLRQTLAETPGDAPALINLGATLEALGRMEEAETCLREVVGLKPGDARALVSLGYLFVKRGDLAAAEAEFAKAAALDPALPDAELGLAIVYFQRGQIRKALPFYEARRRMDIFRAGTARLPEWTRKEDARGKRILLCNEQGLGDTIQFVRYAPLVRALGAEVVIGCPPELERLFNMAPHLGPLVTGGKLPRCDLMIPMLSLMRVVGTDLDTVPATVPYLRAAAADIEKWSRRIGGRERRIGLVWAGRREHPSDVSRSIPLNLFEPLLAQEGMRFYSLQLGARTAELDDLAGKHRPADLSPHIKDFADTAAALECLDLLISVDTAPVHLAGAMNRPVWTLLPFSPDWRWMLERDDTPWYPSMRLFRQPRPGDWSAVIAAVVKALRSGALPASR